jgi:type IV fimbrial biogenesis protein FimT
MTIRHTTNKGLTLLELMITLTITGILLASSAPSFTESIRNTRLVTQVNELQASLSLARSEAVKRNESVTVCGINVDGDDCEDNWQDGWIVLVSATGEVLRIHDALTGGNALTFSQADGVIYGANGIASSGVNGTFTICDARGTAKATGLVIGLSGRPRLAIASDALVCGS